MLVRKKLLVERCDETQRWTYQMFASNGRPLTGRSHGLSDYMPVLKAAATVIGSDIIRYEDSTWGAPHRPDVRVEVIA